jgi:sarcosine oxidase subunit alpha
VRAVHESLGVIDVSTLGKLLVEGPDAVALLERLYPNRFGDMKPGRIRYGVLTSDGGRIMDDGTIARLDDDLFYVTTTSTGADAVTAWFEWWNAVWGYEAEVVNVTGALAAVNLAGPRAREALGQLVDDPDDVAADAFRYLDAKHLDVAGVPTLALRIGFVGELGYELHFPSPAGEHLWDALVAGGARPFGLEPQRVLRLEKGHVIVGQDTDSESNLYSSGMSWLPKMDKDDFVGKFALEHFAQRDEKEKLVGFTMETNVLPAEGAQIVIEGLPAGRVTSARRSEAVGEVIGLAWVPTDRSEPGTRVEIVVDRSVAARGSRTAPSTTRPGSGCGREPRVPLAVARRRGTRSPRRYGALSRRRTPVPCAISRSGASSSFAAKWTRSRRTPARSSSGSRSVAASCSRATTPYAPWSVRGPQECSRTTRPVPTPGSRSRASRSCAGSQTSTSTASRRQARSRT